MTRTADSSCLPPDRTELLSADEHARLWLPLLAPVIVAAAAAVRAWHTAARRHEVHGRRQLDGRHHVRQLAGVALQAVAHPEGAALIRMALVSLCGGSRKDVSTTMCERTTVGCIPVTHMMHSCMWSCSHSCKGCGLTAAAADLLMTQCYVAAPLDGLVWASETVI